MRKINNIKEQISSVENVTSLELQNIITKFSNNIKDATNILQNKINLFTD